LGDFLQAHALPYVQVKVARYEDAYLSLLIRLSIDTTAFDPETIQANVRAALFEAFSLRKRKLGQACYIGEVYRIAERVQGVANSVCAFMENTLGSLEIFRGSDEVVRIVHPLARQVLYLHRDRSTLELSYERDTL